MINLYIEHISNQLSVKIWQVEHCVALLEEGATIPFISRYRKERTGALDEVQVAEIKHYFLKFQDLEKRKIAVIGSIDEQGKLTKELKKEIEICVEPQILEDLYLPYKPKRRTKASIAKEKGLEPLARLIYDFNSNDPASDAEKFLNEDVMAQEEALSGAREIIAEWLSEDSKIR